MTEGIKRVSDEENKAVDGHALCAEMFFERHIAEAQALRARQAAYLASLPTEPAEAIKAAQHILHPSGDNYPFGFEEALHCSVALEAMVKEMVRNPLALNERALFFFTEKLVDRLGDTLKELEALSCVLANPARLAREARVAAVHASEAAAQV